MAYYGALAETLKLVHTNFIQKVYSINAYFMIT